MQLVQLPTRQKLLSNTTCADTLPASDQINTHRPTNQSFLPAFFGSQSSVSHCSSPMKECATAMAVYSKPTSSLSHQLHSVCMIVHSSGTPPGSWFCPPISLLSHGETLSPFISVSIPSKYFCGEVSPSFTRTVSVVCYTSATHTMSPWFLSNGERNEECLRSALT